jgi:hypothetical protein
LAVVASVCLACSAVVLPWIRWGSSYQESTNVGITVSLWNAVSNGADSGLGASWMPAIAAGMVAALVGSLVELVRRPVSRLPRWLALAGFVTAVGASCLGFVLGVGDLAGTASVTFTTGFTPSLEIGFWVALGIAVVGAVISLIRLTSPPNPARLPAPFAPSPWGSPPGIMPAGYYPPGAESSEYVVRGKLPPGYVPPSYKPAVYPKPGFVTPAYIMPGHPFPGLDQPFAEISDDSPPATEPGSSSTGAPAPGHLAVLEAGHSKIFAVEPGKRLLVGRDPDAEIRVSDQKVSERHATIERRGDGWAVQDVDAMNPTRLIDGWGTNRQVRGETEISSGQVVVGDVVITLYASQP